MSTLLAIHAHPDDESSKGAATVARYSDEGIRCVLVTATGGEAGDILNPAMDRPEVRDRLTEIRLEELAKAAAIIGYAEVFLLGYRDSGMPDTEPNSHPDAFVNADREEALGRIVEIIRSERPQVVLSYDEHERYPHPDHLRVHDLGLEAFEAAADGDRFPEAGPPWQAERLFAPVFSSRRIRTLHEAMLDRGLESPLSDVIEEWGQLTHHRPVVSVRVTDTLDRAREALRTHATQIDPDGPWFQIPMELIRTVYPFEDFELLVTTGLVEPESGDLFAGI